MPENFKSLAALTLACAVSAAIFGFGADVYSFRSAYAGDGREALIQTTRLLVYIGLGVLLVFRGNWWGVPAAVLMALAASGLQWLGFPLAYDWAALEDPVGYEREIGEVGRPTLAGSGMIYDVLGVGITSAFAQGLRMMAHVNPKATPDE